MSASDYAEEAMAAVGGEDAEFLVFSPPGDGRVRLSCPECAWGYAVNEIPLWELVVDARGHWEEKHRAADRRPGDGIWMETEQTGGLQSG
jgi:hypothetical protein